MKRAEFKQIIKIRSFWKIDRRKVDYLLPSGDRLSSYIRKLVDSQMALDHLAINESGDLHVSSETTWDNEKHHFSDITIYMPFRENENCSYDEQERRINTLVFEMIR